MAELVEFCDAYREHMRLALEWRTLHPKMKMEKPESGQEEEVSFTVATGY